jgi:predicted small metal-binding protein
MPMPTLNCPCGHVVSAQDEDELVETSRAHLREAHPERSYTREQILFFADP